jgi:hypothetical protein
LLRQLIGARGKIGAQRRNMRLVAITAIQGVWPAGNMNDDFAHDVQSVPHVGLGQQAIQLCKGSGGSRFQPAQARGFRFVGGKTGLERSNRRLQPGHQDMFLSDGLAPVSSTRCTMCIRWRFSFRQRCREKGLCGARPDALRRAVDGASLAWPMGARDSAGLPMRLWHFNILRLF